MNLFGSYRALLGNSISAMSAAIEIYNKPKMDYREECFIILLVNAWELLLKATLAKNHKRIYYDKKRNNPYRTLSISDTLEKCRAFFPKLIDYKATSTNLQLLIDYRDNCVHFYNSPGFGVIVFALAQTCIVNYSDFVSEVFNKAVTDSITITLLPLSFAPPIDPIEFLRKTPSDSTETVKEFTMRIRELVSDLEDSGNDTGRLLTLFKVNLVSTKKVARADLIVGVQETATSGEQVLVQKISDPNKTHPYREIDILGRKNDTEKPGLKITISGRPLTQMIFRSIVFRYDVKNNQKYCWIDSNGAVVRYSMSFIDFIKRLSEEDISNATSEYAAYLKKKK